MYERRKRSASGCMRPVVSKAKILSETRAALAAGLSHFVSYCIIFLLIHCSRCAGGRRVGSIPDIAHVRDRVVDEDSLAVRILEFSIRTKDAAIEVSRQVELLNIAVGIHEGFMGHSNFAVLVRVVCREGRRVLLCSSEVPGVAEAFEVAAAERVLTVVVTDERSFIGAARASEAKELLTIRGAACVFLRWGLLLRKKGKR